MSKNYYKTLLFAPKGAFGMNVATEEIEAELNRLGQLGWDLVSVTGIPNTSNLLIIMENTDAKLSDA